jgi:hypothetical protein
LKAKLELSRFNDDESITRMIQDFEAKVSIWSMSPHATPLHSLEVSFLPWPTY